MFTLSVLNEGSNVELLFSPNLCGLCVSAMSPLPPSPRFSLSPLFPFTLSAFCEELTLLAPTQEGSAFCEGPDPPDPIFSLTPLAPLHTGHFPVTTLFPTHTKNIGG